MPWTRIWPTSISDAARLCVAISACAVLPVQAEPSPNQNTLEEVVVTGLRHSLDSAVQIKLNTDSITESVVAEDIGKLPDVSIAESLARLPGVAAQRVNGRAQDLSIRGMGPEFSLTLFNSNEIASTGLNRSFQYDELPAELVNTLTVYKTSEVTLGNQGLAGTVNIQTIKPLTLTDRSITVGARYEQNDQHQLIPGVSAHGNRLTGTYIDQLLDHTFGIAIGYSHLDTPSEKKYLNPWDYGSLANGDFNYGQALHYTGTVGLGWDGFENGVATTSSIRDTGLLVLEYKPNETYHATLNYLHSQFNDKLLGAELVGDMANYAGYGPTGISVSQSGNTQTVTNGYLLDTTRGDDRHDTIDSVDLNNTIKLGAWNLNLAAAYSKAIRDEIIGEAYITNTLPTTYSFSYLGFSEFSQASIGTDLANANNMNLSTYWGSAGYQEFVNTDDQAKSLHLQLSNDLDKGFLRKIELGAHLSQRSKVESVLSRAENFSPGVGSSCTLGTCAAIPASFHTAPVSLGFSGAGGLAYFDVLSALSNTNTYTPASTNNKVVAYNWSVDEKLTTIFVKLGIAFDALIPWHGNLGAQLIHTSQSSTGVYTDSNGDQTQNITLGTSYNNFQPAFMLIGDVTANSRLRFGVARSQSRPEMSDMAAGLSASISPTQLANGQTQLLWSGSGGNPLLRPWISTDYDLDFETYFTKSSYVAIALFDKQIGTAIRSGVTSYNFTGFVDPSGKVAASPIGSLTAPVDVSGGYVRGVELSGQLSLSDLNTSLTGFGLLGSMAYSESNLPGLDINGVINPDITFDGLSRLVASATVFYENNGWQVRIAERYRSGYSAFRLNAFKFVKDEIRPEAIIDSQVGYTFQHGMFQNLELMLQGENLTNRPYVVSQTSYSQTVLSQYHTFGRTFLIGANYKF
jgi:iron complex outermembrane recepter protein